MPRTPSSALVRSAAATLIAFATVALTWSGSTTAHAQSLPTG